MDFKKRQPLGIELVKRGIVTEQDIENALQYQREHPSKKIGDILHIIKACDDQKLINAIGEVLGEKAIIIKPSEVKVHIQEYVSIDVAKKYKAIPFEVDSGKIKVCFADTANKQTIETIRLLLLNKGLVMDRYITFESVIEDIIASIEGQVTESINISQDMTRLVDNIIRTAMEKRTSDIHIEPMEDKVRVRYRIDGELITVADINKNKQTQLIGRLKAISNMHQEKQDDQDGRILLYPDYNIRVSSQRNVYGEKFVLRLLRKNQSLKSIFDLGFPKDDELLNKCFNKKNSITIVAAPTGEGKTTTLYSIIDYLNSPEINITTVEDPVEIRIPGLNQVEIDARNSFNGALRTILRQDPDIILVGEIRDEETAAIAMQSGQTGHYVLSTIHTIDAIEVITRLRKMGISNYDIASTLATSMSQRLVRRICPHCAKERDFTQKEKEIIEKLGAKYDEKFDFTGKKTYTPVGCEKCNNMGYSGRIAMFEILTIDENIKELIVDDKSTIEIKKEAMRNGYRPLLIDGLKKVVAGVTTLDELNHKLVVF